MVGTPTLANGVLYFGTFDKHLYALSIENRELVWPQPYETANWAWSSPVFDEESGLLIGGDLDGHVFALQAEDGSEEWSWSNATSDPIVGNPSIAERDGQRVVFAASGDSKVYVLDITDGDLLQEEEIQGEFPQQFLFFSTGIDTRPVDVYGPPVLFGDLVLLGPHEGTQPLQAYDSASLERVWVFDPSEEN
jgi:outer membrane protein assembly factor BamB